MVRSPETDFDFAKHIIEFDPRQPSIHVFCFDLKLNILKTVDVLRLTINHFL